MYFLLLHILHVYFIRLVFLDFSSTFNTVQPHLMGQKLLQIDVNPQLILWILSFLTDKHQKVQVNGHLSSSQVHHRAL